MDARTLQLLGRDNSPPVHIVNGTYLLPALNGTYINPFYCTNAICPLSYGQLRYLPSFSGNLAYLIIFAIFMLAQTAQGLYYRTWGFWVGMVCGLMLEVVGYVGRLLIHSNDFVFNYFIIYLVCLTIGPAFISASIYLCLSRLVVIYGRDIARFSAKFYTTTFICCDIVSLSLQAAGGGYAATSGSAAQGQTGINIMIAGLAFQVACLALFIVLGVHVLMAVRRASSYQMGPHYENMRSRRIFRLFPYAIALATITIYVRCCYRVAELRKGFGSRVANNQVLFMILEGPMIMIAALSLTVCHPGCALGGVEGWKMANWTWKKSPAISIDEAGDRLNEAKEIRRG